VTIYAREQPPATTSDVAGARFYPFDVFDKKVATPEFIASLWQAARVSYEAFRALPAARYGVHRYPTYACRQTPFPPESLLNLNSPVRELLPGLRRRPLACSPALGATRLTSSNRGGPGRKHEAREI